MLMDRDADASRTQNQVKAAGRRSEWHGGVIWAQSQAKQNHVPTTAVPAPDPTERCHPPQSAGVWPNKAPWLLR